MNPARRPERRSTAAAGEQCRAVSTGAGRLVALALAALLAATVLATPAGAATRWFTVEIIVFDVLENDGLQAEYWPADPGAPSTEGAVALEPGPDGAFPLVNRSGLSLGGVWGSLRRSAGYRPFLHAGWRVPGLRRGAARPAHVGPRLGGGGSGAAGPDGGERPAVQGTVKVSLSRYLHVELDLVYSRPASGEAAAPSAAPTRFRLVSERRMRSRELHYFDHPLFGVLIRIAPL